MPEHMELGSYNHQMSSDFPPTDPHSRSSKPVPAFLPTNHKTKSNFPFFLGDGHAVVSHSEDGILTRRRLSARTSRDQVLRAGEVLVIDQVRDELVDVAAEAVDVVAGDGQEGEDGVDAVAAGVDVPAVAGNVHGRDRGRGAVGAVVGADGACRIGEKKS